MKRTTPWALALGLLLPLVLTAPARAVVIELSPSAQSVALASPVTVDLNVSGLGAGVAPSIGDWDIDLAFDPAVLTATFVSFSSQLDVLGLGIFFRDASVSGGVLNMVEVSADTEADLNNLQAGAFTLATIGFSATGVGTSALGLTINSLGDAAGNLLAASLVNGSVTVTQAGTPPGTPVPEPSALLLFAVGLAGLGLAARRRRQCLPVGAS